MSHLDEKIEHILYKIHNNNRERVIICNSIIEICNIDPKKLNGDMFLFIKHNGRKDQFKFINEINDFNNEQYLNSREKK